MGYKVNPVSFRLGIQRNWNSFWFGSFDYQQLFEEDLQIRNYVQNIYAKNKIPHGTCYIKRWLNNSSETAISLYNPPNDYETIFNKRILRNSMRLITGQKQPVLLIKRTKYEGSSFFFTIPVKNSQLVAYYIAYELEKRNPFNEIMQDIFDWIKETDNFLGIHIQCSGRFSGEDRTRTLLKKKGKMPFSTMSSNIDYGFSDAFTVYGAIGVKVWLFLSPEERKNNDLKSKKNKIFKIAKRASWGNRD
jgi:small subunit ribosomal protein S3